MPRAKLSAKKRKVFGRKVKKLRREGILPGNLYGRDIDSQALSIDQKEFLEVFKEAGESGLIDLKVGRAKAKPVLAANLQLDPVTDDPIHVDFRLIDLTEKTTVTVPIELAGEAPAIEQGDGVLIQPLQEIGVEALPEDLPDHISIDISSLEEINDDVRVKDIKVPDGVELQTDADEVVAKIEPPIAEEEVAEPEVPEAEEGVEGEVPAEGEETEGEEATEEEATGEEKPEETPKEE